MNSDCQKQPITYRISYYIRGHKASLGVFLAAYGAFYLSTVLLSGWTIADWGRNITKYPPSTINTILPRSFIDPIFFVTSFPALIIGSAILCNYSLRGITAEATPSKQYVAILLTAFGFGYIVIGAWPLGQKEVFPWEWQKQIINWGPAFAWILYILGLIVLAVGIFSLYKHSRIYHQKNPSGEEQIGEAVA
jgi:hypothetical protein